MNEKSKYKLTLYISGVTPAASRAIKNLEEICKEELESDGYKIEVIDVREHPELSEKAHILATPTVERELPPPIRRIIGDLSNREQVLIGLDLQ